MKNFFLQFAFNAILIFFLERLAIPLYRLPIQRRGQNCERILRRFTNAVLFGKRRAFTQRKAFLSDEEIRCSPYFYE